MTQAREIATAIASGKTLMASEALWNDFGLDVPTPHSWRRHLRPAWRRKLDQRIARVLLCAGVATYIETDWVPLRACDIILAHLAADPECKHALGRDAPHDAMLALGAILLDFSQYEPMRWGFVVASHLHLHEIPDRTLRTRVTRYCIARRGAAQPALGIARRLAR
jgi:hypothetical protein